MKGSSYRVIKNIKIYEDASECRLTEHRWSPERIDDTFEFVRIRSRSKTRFPNPTNKQIVKEKKKKNGIEFDLS